MLFYAYVVLMLLWYSKLKWFNYKYSANTVGQAFEWWRGFDFFVYDLNNFLSSV